MLFSNFFSSCSVSLRASEARLCLVKREAVILFSWTPWYIVVDCFLFLARLLPPACAVYGFLIISSLLVFFVCISAKKCPIFAS